MAEKITELTQQGLKDTQERYEYLVKVVREEVKDELKEARSLGDLSENADYDAARERQSAVEAEISELEEMLKNYVLIDTNISTETVHTGSTVDIYFEDTNQLETYIIVGYREADPLNHKLSNETPVAKAILNHKVGNTVTVSVKNPYKVTIKKIYTPSEAQAFLDDVKAGKLS